MCVKFAADSYSNSESAANFTHIIPRLTNMFRYYTYLDQFRKPLWSGPYAYTHNHDIILADKYRNTNCIEKKNRITSVVISFSSRDIGNRQRRLSAKWFTENPWLRHSMNDDALYCAPCVLFINKVTD